MSVSFAIEQLQNHSCSRRDRGAPVRRFGGPRPRGDAYECFLIDYTAVKHVDLAIRVIGVSRIVRDYADRTPAACNSANSAITCSPFLESKLPVGSSANRIDGLPTSARATATRCC